MKAPVRARTQRGATKGVRRAQLSEEVAGHLRGAIMTGRLRPGTFIRLDDTAAELGVSITPVREALLTLRGEGMVDLEPHRGHVVLPLSRTDVQDIFWLQSTIAKELAASACTRMTDEEIDELERLGDELADAVAAADATAITAAEFEFHRAFNHAADRLKLAWFLLHATRYTPHLLYATDPGWGADAVENHRLLIAALRARDTAEVVRLTEWQFTDGARRLTEVLEDSGLWATPAPEPGQSGAQ